MQQKSYLKITLLLVSTLTVMAAATVAASLPPMTIAFKDVPNIELLAKLVLTLPSLFIAILAPIVGININRFGRKRLLVIGMILYGVGGTSGFFLDTIYMILLSRTVLGVSVAIILSVVSTLVGDYFEAQERHSYTGLQVAFMNIGGIVFIVLGGILAEHSWRDPFLIYLTPFFMLPLVLKYIYEPQVHQEISDMRFSLKKIYPILLYNFIGISVFYMIPTQIPFLLYYNFGIEGTITGLAVATSMLFSTIISMQYKHIKKKISYHKIYSIPALGLGIGFLTLSFASNLTIFFLGLAISGIGAGMLFVNNINHLLHFTTPKTRGKIVGINSSVMAISMFFSPIFVAPLIEIFNLKETFGIIGVIILFSSLWFLRSAQEE